MWRISRVLTDFLFRLIAMIWPEKRAALFLCGEAASNGTCLLRTPPPNAPAVIPYQAITPAGVQAVSTPGLATLVFSNSSAPSPAADSSFYYFDLGGCS